MGIFGSNRQPRRVRRSLDGISRGSDSYFQRSKRAGLSLGPQELKPKRKIWKRLLLLFLMLLVVGAAGIVGLYFYIKNTPLKGETAGRINIMVLGVDDAASLSDTVMIVSINTQNKAEPKVAMISIPRDLVVEIPQFGESKINAAYTYGQNNNYPGGGAALSKRTIEDTFELPIHYYATLDFTGFRQLIDTVGGVDIEVKQAIDDPFYPNADYSGYSYFSIAAGQQHMDGELALRYARSRITTSDFDRAARQQQIVQAFKAKVLSKETLLDKKKIDQLRAVLKDHVQTDLSNRELLKLADISRRVKDDRVTRHVIDSSNFLTSGTLNDSSLTPKDGDFDAINAFIKNIFDESQNNLPEAQQ
ncbi:LCP family protein [Candidatus Microgenomates bacterium]|nr:LCP family protein [Candidatus Microgenomates bacterium]